MVPRLIPLLLAAAAAGCSWHPDGAGGALPEPGATALAPAPGMALGEALAVARVREGEGFRVRVEDARFSRVRDGRWEELSEQRAEQETGSAEAGVEHVVTLVRSCRDWVGRERFEAERASWFLLREGRLAAFDHWSFGPRCAVFDHFAPARADALETERTLRRWLEQRHPPPPPPVEIRLRRGLGYLAADRLDEARVQLRVAEQSLEARQDLFGERIASRAEEDAYTEESTRLRRLRDELSAGLARRERELRREREAAPAP